jgi:rifampicin phosphotransferase
VQLAATEDFNIDWADPADARLTWNWDRMHVPRPMVPLAQNPFAASDNRSLSTRTRFVNGYPYQTGFEIPAPPSEVMERGLHTVWEGEYVPRIRAFCDKMRKADYDSMTARELADMAEGIVDEGADTFRLTMVVIFPFMLPTMQLVGFGEAELGDDAGLLIGTLLQGFGNETSSAGMGLALLAERVAKSPELSAAIKAGVEDLSTVPGGKEFLQEFDAYLDEFGGRLESWTFFETPTWLEDRSIPLRLIRQYVENPSTSPAAAIERSARQRTEALEEVNRRLDGEKRETFHALLEAAKAHVAMSEGRAHWQLSTCGALRMPMVALGRKLVQAGVIDAPEDVFFLYWEEALAEARQPSGSKADLVRERRAEYARWCSLDPVPPFIGAPPDDSAAPPEMQVVAKYFFGMGGEVSTEENLLTGFGASRGVHTGRARVVRSLDESDKLEPGDVLVCITTAAPWTPLFAIAGAVVTDSGGVISHSAICAREYAIPCVVGTQVATLRIPDGTLVTVDGDAGTVQIVG